MSAFELYRNFIVDQDNHRLFNDVRLAIAREDQFQIIDSLFIEKCNEGIEYRKVDYLDSVFANYILEKGTSEDSGSSFFSWKERGMAVNWLCHVAYHLQDPSAIKQLITLYIDSYYLAVAAREDEKLYEVSEEYISPETINSCIKNSMSRLSDSDIVSFLNLIKNDFERHLTEDRLDNDLEMAYVINLPIKTEEEIHYLGGILTREEFREDDDLYEIRSHILELYLDLESDKMHLYEPYLINIIENEIDHHILWMVGAFYDNSPENLTKRSYKAIESRLPDFAIDDQPAWSFTGVVADNRDRF